MSDNVSPNKLSEEDRNAIQKADAIVVKLKPTGEKFALHGLGFFDDWQRAGKPKGFICEYVEFEADTMEDAKELRNLVRSIKGGAE